LHRLADRDGVLGNAAIGFAFLHGGGNLERHAFMNNATNNAIL
jgi:hypothetical protein